MLSFLALIKTFSECWTTLIVMIYDIFASQTEHIFAIYAPVQKNNLWVFGNQLLLKMKEKIWFIAQYALDINMVTSKYWAKNCTRNA